MQKVLSGHLYYQLCIFNQCIFKFIRVDVFSIFIGRKSPTNRTFD